MTKFRKTFSGVAVELRSDRAPLHFAHRERHHDRCAFGTSKVEGAEPVATGGDVAVGVELDQNVSDACGAKNGRIDGGAFREVGHFLGYALDSPFNAVD